MKKDDLIFWLFVSICFAAGLYFNPSAGAIEDGCVIDTAKDVPVMASSSSTPQCVSYASAR